MIGVDHDLGPLEAQSQGMYYILLIKKVQNNGRGRMEAFLQRGLVKDQSKKQYQLEGKHWLTLVMPQLERPPE